MSLAYQIVTYKSADIADTIYTIATEILTDLKSIFWIIPAFCSTIRASRIQEFLAPHPLSVLADTSAGLKAHMERLPTVMLWAQTHAQPGEIFYLVTLWLWIEIDSLIHMHHIMKSRIEGYEGKEKDLFRV